MRYRDTYTHKGERPNNLQTRLVRQGNTRDPLVLHREEQRAYRDLEVETTLLHTDVETQTRVCT